MKTNVKNKGLVSVIIPVYNVENYLKRCIDSVLRQTYENLDIILVDDGSTDQSGTICDNYTKSDSRVRVLHKDNGGQSDARNAGIEIAKGEYLYFVDSDDFITDDSIDFLHNSLLVHDADIATHGYVIYYGEDTAIESNKLVDNVQLVLSKDDALEKLMYEKYVTTSACMKLYKRELFGKIIRFPSGKLYEDLAIVYRLFSKARTIVLNTTPKYYYYERSGSTTQSNFSLSRMDGLEIAEDQLNYICTNHPALIPAAQYRLFAEAVYIAMKIPMCDNLYNDARNTTFQVIKKYRKCVLLNRSGRGSIRQRALIAFLGVRTMVLFFRVRSLAWQTINKVSF